MDWWIWYPPRVTPSGSPGGAAGAVGFALGVWANSVSGDDTTIAHKSTARAIAIRRLQRPQAAAKLRSTCTHADAGLSISEDWCTSFLGGAIRCSLLEEHAAEIGAMNLRVTHGAGLILRRLIVRGTDWPAGSQLGRESVALQTEHVHQAHLEQPGIGGTVGGVATAAALSLHRHVLIDERTLLVDMALIANGVAARQAT